MNLIIITLLLISFIIYIYAFKKDILAPANLFPLIILSTYFISCLKLSGLQHSYSFNFTCFIILMIISFILGTKISKPKNKTIVKYDYYDNRLKKTIYILFFMVLISFIVMWIKLGAPPLISKIDRSTYFLSGFGTIYLMIEILNFLIIFDLFQKKLLGKTAYFLLTISLIMIILMSNKFQIIYFLCQYIILYNILVKKIKLKSILKLGIIIIIIFILYYKYVYNGMYITNEEMYMVNKIKFPSQFQMFTSPYMYLSFNYENLYNYIFNEHHILGMGYYTFENILDLFKIKNFIFPDSSLLINQWSNCLQYKWLTTGTIFKELYMDFGFIGSFIGMFIIGYICGKYYNKIKHKNINIFNLYFYVSCTVSLFLSFFTNNFISVNFLLNSFCCYIIMRYCYKKV